jgi:hypothetical protein
MLDNLDVSSHQLTGGNVKESCSLLSTILFKSLYFTKCAIKMIQVITNTSFITELLEHISSHLLLGFDIIICCVYWTC